MALICFARSYRNAETRLAWRGVAVSDETIRQWYLKFGQTYANELRHRRPRPGDKGHLAEVVLKIKGKQCFLGQAVNQNGVVLDILVQYSPLRD